MAGVAWTLRPAIEATVVPAEDGMRRRLGLGRSRGVIARLSVLFALDAFAGGFIPQSLMAFWFAITFGVGPATLGAIFFVANLLAAVSSLSAARIAARFGLINTMVFTHLPSNVLLLFVPLMPTLRAGGPRPARPLRAQPDGRADAPVVRPRGRRSRRALGGGRRDRHRPDGRCGHLAVDRDPAPRAQRRAGRGAVLSSRAA